MNLSKSSVLLILPDRAGIPLAFCISILNTVFVVLSCGYCGIAFCEDTLPPFPVAFISSSICLVSVSSLSVMIHSPWFLWYILLLAGML